MDFKNRLILFFILIAVIPIAALSIVFTVTVIEFKDQISNVYSGFVANMDVLQKGRAALLGMRADLLQYAASQDPTQKAAAISHVQALREEAAGVVGEYRRIEDLPGGFRAPGPLVQPGSYNIAGLASDENLLANRIEQQWKDFSAKADDLAILSTDARFAPQATAAANQLVVLADRLVESYDALIALNTNIGAASREQSQGVMQAAFFYGGLASAISAACATAAAILVSKRVVLGDLVRMTKLELVETTLRDLIGGGADALVGVIKSQIPEEGAIAAAATGGPHSSHRRPAGGSGQMRDIAPASTSAVVPESEDVVIGRKMKPGAGGSGPPPARAFVEGDGDNDNGDSDSSVAPGVDMKGKLVVVNAGSRLGAQAAGLLDELFGAGQNNRLVVLTRRGSNIYHRAQREGRAAATVYVMADPSAGNGDGYGSAGKERVVPAVDEGALAQAIERALRENPSATVLVDNATELIYTLGFERAFALLRRASSAVSSYEGASIVVLVNKNAHEPRIIEAIGSVANDLVGW